MVANGMSGRVRAVAGALLAVVLLSSTGCGFCLVDNQCATGEGQCCRRFRCVDICAAKSALKSSSADELLADRSMDFGELLANLFPPPLE